MWLREKVLDLYTAVASDETHGHANLPNSLQKKKKTTFAGVLLFDVVFKGGKGGDMVQFRRRYKKACAGSIRVHSMGKQSK